MVFHRSLSDSKSPQVSRTLLSILADDNYVVVWMTSTRSLISKSSSPFNNPSVTVPRASITISINFTFMCQSFFNSIIIIIITIIIVIALLRVFPHQRYLMIFHWKLSDCKTPKIYPTLLNILADLKNAVLWMVTTFSLIPNSFNFFTNPLESVLSAPIETEVSLMLLSLFVFFFQFYNKAQELISLFTFI